MTFAKDAVIEALRLRYDHYSAQSVFELARDRAGLPDKPSYDAAELRVWRDALALVGDRVGRVLELVDEMLATTKPATLQPAPMTPAPLMPAAAIPIPLAPEPAPVAPAPIAAKLES